MRDKTEQAPESVEPRPRPSDLATPAVAASTGARDAPGMLGALTGASSEARARGLARLQRSAGNAAVARAVADRSTAAAAADHGISETPPPRGSTPGPEVRTYKFEARVRYDPLAGSPAAPAPAGRLSDAVPGGESHIDAGQIAPLVTNPPMPAGADPKAAGTGVGQPAAAPEGTPAAAAAPGASTAAPQATGEVQEVRLPNIVIPELAHLDITDSVSSWLGYSGTITRGGGGIAPGPLEFGVTNFGDVRLVDVTSRQIGLLGVFLITGTVEHRINWQVRTATGPTGQVSVGSFLDGAITNANYAAVANDLTPNMADLNGRPPRAAFWAQDLTERHEEFHAADAKSNGPSAVSGASAWLSAQTAANVAGVYALLVTVPGRVVTALVAAMAFPAVEHRAYGDGAGAYSRRATAIRTTGGLGLYP